MNIDVDLGGTDLPNVNKVAMMGDLYEVISTPGGVYVWSSAPLITCYTEKNGDHNKGVIIPIDSIRKMFFGP